MSKILCIETSTSLGSVAISCDGLVTAFVSLQPGENISSKITLMIQQAASDAKISLKELDAVGVNLGPGSYTSLRTGLSAAKGICYALSKPLVGADTFEILYDAADNKTEYDNIICMVDARRMDAYVRVYDVQANTCRADEFATLDEEFFSQFKNKRILCTGDGASRLKDAEFIAETCKISENTQNAAFMTRICEEKLHNGTLLDIAYSVPYYFKSPNITTPKNIF